jgi:putative inorganic carbon (HCO3(-)) transporter
MKILQAIAQRLAQIEIYVVTLAVAVSIVSSRLLAVALGAAAFFWLCRAITQRQICPRTPADWPIFLLGVMIIVTLFVSVNKAVTLPQVYRLILGIAFFYAIVNWAVTIQRITWVAFGASFAGLGIAALAPLSVEWIAFKINFIPEGIYERFTLLFRDTVHPNVLAGNLLILLPIPLSLLLYTWRGMNWFWRVILSIATTGMLLILLLSQSRGAWLSLLVVLAIVPLLRFRRGWIITGLVVLFGLVALSYYGITPVVETFAQSYTLTSLDSRLEAWERGVFMVQDFPLTGIGMGLYGSLADLLYPFFLPEPGTIPHAHNLLLQIAVDLGIPGLVAWLGIFFAVSKAAWDTYRTGQYAQQAQITALGAGLIASLVALMTHGLVDAVTWGMVRPAPIVWALWGIAGATVNLQNSNK